MYIKTYTGWNIVISPLGGFILLAVMLTGLWKMLGRPATAEV